MTASEQEPEFMVFYFCNRCKLDFARHHGEPPVCFSCGLQDKAEFLRKEPMTKELMINRMKALAARTLENLQKAYQVRPEDADEAELMDAMLKAQELKDKIDRM